MARTLKVFFVLMAFACAFRVAAGKTYDFPVQGDRRYVLSFDWSYAPAVGEAEGAVIQRITFVTMSGKRVSAGAADRRALPPGSRYAYEFYAPADATQVELGFNVRGGGKFAEKNVKLDEVKEAPTVNVNPHFERGFGNWSGIARVENGAARFFRTPDGKVHFFGGFDFTTTWTPVTAGRKYKLRLQAMSYYKNRIAPFLTFRGPGKPDMKTDLARGYKDKNSDAPIVLEYDITVPEGMTHLQLCLYYTTLDWLELKEEK